MRKNNENIIKNITAKVRIVISGAKAGINTVNICEARLTEATTTKTMRLARKRLTTSFNDRGCFFGLEAIVNRIQYLNGFIPPPTNKIYVNVHPLIKQ